MTTPLKRKVLDPDTQQEVGSSKRPKYTLQTPVRNKVLKFIAGSAYAIHAAMFKASIHLNNINVGCQVMNIVFTAHSILRQEAQSITSTLGSKAAKGNPKITVEGKNYDITIDTAKMLLREVARLNNLTYETTAMADDDTPLGEWIGIAGPYLNFLTGFNLRLREMRLGHNEFPVKKTPTETVSYPVSSYGLNKAHHILLTGIRFPPERRSSMVQSMGPMASLLCYLESPQNYSNKFYNACVNSMAHIPNIENILKTIKGQPKSAIKPVIQLLADILILTTARDKHRAFPFPSFFSRLFVEQAILDGVSDKLKTSEGPGPLLADYKITSSLGNNKLFEALNFSGLPSAIFYNEAMKHQWYINGDFSEDLAGQLVFHCYWGTVVEDFGVLKEITNHKSEWARRDTFGKSFQQMNLCGRKSKVGGIKLDYFSKLSSANMTGLLAQGAKQCASIPCFSGTRNRKISDDFFKYLEENTPLGTNALTIHGIQSDLLTILKSVKDKIVASGKIQAQIGTCLWYNVQANTTSGVLSGTTRPVAEDGKVVNETCEYFLS